MNATIHRPTGKGHFSRYAMGVVFFICGLIFCLFNWYAGGVMIAISLVVFYYAPKWKLTIELSEEEIRFSENVVTIKPVELKLSDILEIRRIEEQERRKGFLATFPEFYHYVEFETRQGKIFRMNDIFDEGFNEEIAKLGAKAGIQFKDFFSENIPDPVLEPVEDV